MLTPGYRVFISYSRANEGRKKSLIVHLSTLKAAGIVSLWHDRYIEAGDLWREELEREMSAAEVALFLVSANFIASEFCRDEEVPLMLERHRAEGLLIIPIIVDYCDWKCVERISQFQVLPRSGEPVSGHRPQSKAWTEVAAGLRSRLQNKPSSKKRSDQLFGREEALGWLDAAYRDAQTSVLALVGFGGIGKSSLVRHWLKTRFSQNETARFLVVSFHSQGTREQRGSSDQFLLQALEKLGERDAAKRSAWERGQRLAELVAKQKLVVVLDGLEPLQYGPESGRLEGGLKDPGIHGLLARMTAQPCKSLCIVTSRLRLEDSDLQSASFVQKSVEVLSPKAAGELMRARGVRGSDAEINRAVEHLGRHPLALVMAAEYLQTFATGEVNHLYEMPLLSAKIKEGRHAKSVMAAYEAALRRDGNPLYLELLGVFGLFERPIRWEWLQELSRPPAIKGVTDHLIAAGESKLRAAISRLHRWGMLADPGSLEAPELDAHPLVREYFGERLRQKRAAGWRKAHSRMFDYLISTTKEFPATLDEMELLFAAVVHGCRAGRYQEAAEKVYLRRICREKEFFSTRKLGAFGSDLAALAGFFDPPWRRPVAALTNVFKSFVLGVAGFNLRALGRLTEAVQPTKAGLEAHLSLKDWKNAAAEARNLSELHLAIGQLRQALAYAKRSVKLADKSGDDFRRIVNRTTLADALHQAGHFSEAEEAFRMAERMQKERQPELALLSSLPGYRYCDLLLEQGKYQAVQRRAARTLKIARRSNLLLSIGLDLLASGRADLQQAQKEKKKTGRYAQITGRLNQAVDGLRQAGYLEFVSNGLLARAELNSFKREFSRARADLDEALSIAVRSKMGLHQADCHLAYARLYLEQGEKEMAQESLEVAREMIERMGYHRRDKDVLEIERLIGEMTGDSSEE